MAQKGETEASQSTCLRVVDREVDLDPQEAPGVSSTDPSNGNAEECREEDGSPDRRGELACDIEKDAELEDWVVGDVPADDQWQLQPHGAGKALWQAAGQRRHQHHRRSNKLVGTASVDLSGPHQGTPYDRW